MFLEHALAKMLRQSGPPHEEVRGIWELVLGPHGCRRKEIEHHFHLFLIEARKTTSGT